MVLSLREIRGHMFDYATAFDPALLDAANARETLEHAQRIANMANVVAAGAAARLDVCNAFGDGAKTAAHEYAQTSGTTIHQAAERLRAARRLQHQPDVAAAAKKGRLSPEQAAAITDAADANPTAPVKPLLDLAERASMNELRAECGRVKAAGTNDPDEQRKRIHAARSARRFNRPDGSAGMIATGTPEAIAAMWSAIAATRDRLFKHHRDAGTRERSDALDFDALHQTLTATPATTATAAKPSGGGVKVLVRVDFDTLLRGYPIGGEVCEIAGYGPIAPTAVRDILATGNAFLAAIVTRGEKVVGVAHLGRRATALQVSALQWINPECSRRGCSDLRTQTDHRHDWADTKITLLEWLDGLCAHDHYLKTHKNWSLVNGSGKRDFVPPTDPRHPQHAHHPPQRPPPTAA